MKRFEMIFAMGVIVLVLLCSAADAGHYENGFTAFVKGDFAMASEEYQNGANVGDLGCMFSLGMLYARGDGVAQDREAMTHWLKQSIESSDIKAVANRGLLHLSGVLNEIPKDIVKAYEIISSLENQAGGNIYVNKAISAFYLRGWGTAPDYDKARFFINKMPDGQFRKDELSRIEHSIKMAQSVSATDLLKESSANRPKFDKTYNEKIILIRGYVGNIKEHHEGGYQLELFGEKKNPTTIRIGSIECRFAKEQADILSELTPESLVFITGKYDTEKKITLSKFVLTDCGITQ